MTGWHTERTQGRSAKAVIAVTLLALLLLTAVPVALLAAVIMMILGHVVGGLALFGGSLLAAAMAVAIAAMSGVQHLRKLLSRTISTSCSWTTGSTPTTSRSRTAATTPTSCSWTAASTPKFADLTLVPAILTTSSRQRPGVRSCITSTVQHRD